MKSSKALVLGFLLSFVVGGTFVTVLAVQDTERDSFMWAHQDAGMYTLIYLFVIGISLVIGMAFALTQEE